MEQLLRGRVVTPEGVLEDGVVVVVGDRIDQVRPAGPDEAADSTDAVLLPGMVDLHCHGGGGASFTTGDAAQRRTAALHHLAHGTTSLVASAVTDAPEQMLAVVATLADGVEAGELAGIHIEGPFLSVSRCGAQDPTHLRAPDLGLAGELLDAGRGSVRIMTVAPELPGADDLAALLRERGVIPAAGHTDATAARTRSFLDSGAAGLVTHLFNGMPPFHHRDPGPVAGALASRAVLELIADGVHLADDTATTVLELVGATRVALVTDAMAAAGMPDGDYRLGPQEVSVRGGVARLRGGGSIAGGTSRLLEVVGRMVAAGADLAEVVRAASLTPATVLGVAEVTGALRPGLRADVVVADDRLRPRGVLRAGEWAA